jgi:hypothetical protein
VISVIAGTKFAGESHTPQATRRFASPRADSENVSRSKGASSFLSAALPFLNAPPQIVVRYEHQTCRKTWGGEIRSMRHKIRLEINAHLLDSSPPVAGLMRFPEANHFSMLVRSYLEQRRKVASGTARRGTAAVERAKLRT